MSLSRTRFSAVAVLLACALAPPSFADTDRSLEDIFVFDISSEWWDAFD